MKLDFDALYRSHYRRVFALCVRMLREHARAEDATQEVFMRAQRAKDQYDERQPVHSWLFGIASNYCIDLLRRQARQTDLFRVSDAEVVELESPDSDHIDVLVSAERANELRTAIGQLPDKYRVPIVLAYFSGESYEAIASRLGVTPNHVGVLLLRARRLLRSVLVTSSKEAQQ